MQFRLLIRRIAGWLGADGNPLRRRSDRFEGAVRLTLVLAFVIAAPMLAPAVGKLTDVSGMREVHAEQSWRQVDAIVVRSAPQQFDGYGAAATVWLRGRWQAPSGAIRYGLVPTQAGAQKGTAVPIWVDRRGQITGRHPLTADLVTLRVVVLEMLTLLGLAAAMLVLAWLVRWMLDRRRMAYWGIEWTYFGPRWTSRR
jgi:hypothetical protein